MRNTLNCIGDRLAAAEKLFLQVVMALLTITVVIHIATRNAGLHIDWTYDVSMLLFYWLVFIGAAYAVRSGSHYVIDIWQKSKLVRFRRPVIVFSSVAVAIFLVVLVWQGFFMTWLVRGRISGAGEIGMSFFVVSIPISSMLSLFHLIEAFLREWDSAKGVAP